MLTKNIAIGLSIKDFTKAFEFYTTILDLKVKTEDQKNKFAELLLGDTVLTLLTDRTLDGMFGSGKFNASDSQAVVIAAEVDSLEKAYNDLKRKDVNFITKPKTTPWGQKVAYFKDPEGYIWELSERLG